MGLLRDEDLYRVIRSQSIIEPLPDHDMYDKDSPVQPSSIDLHVGEIFVADKKDRSGNPLPLKEKILKTGQIAIVSTRERLRLPSNVAGIGFPPSRVSIQGLLMTNPGHIDPGYEGTMHLTVINMGKEDFVLRNGDLIVTVLLVELTAPAKADWRQRGGSRVGDDLLRGALSKLSQDFANVEARAKSIAKAAVTRAGILGTVGGAILAFLGMLTSNYYGVKPELDVVKEQVASFKERTEGRQAIDEQFTEIRRRLGALEAHDTGHRK